MADTDIEYLTKSWNPLQSKIKGASGNGYHCTKVDEGCSRCWAEGMNHRFGNKLPFNAKPHEFEVKKSELLKPLGWRQKQRVGVQFMGDLFHKDVPFKLINKVFDVMATDMIQRSGKAGEREGEEAFRDITIHKYFVLTKRPERILEFINWVKENGDTDCPFAHQLEQDNEIPSRIWFGTSISDQPSANIRVPELLKIKQDFPTANLWLSVEPMLGKIELDPCQLLDPSKPEEPVHFNNTASWLKQGIGWVVCGGESGRGARKCEPDWVRFVRDQCKSANVPFHFKQWGEFVHVEQMLAPSKLIGYSGLDFKKVGKHKAGRMLDGVMYDEYP